MLPSSGQKRVRGGGTLHHMAPELVSNYINKAAGRPTVSYDGFACDMWALGVMLIQLLTGRLPFWPKSGFDYLSMHALLAQWVGLLARLDNRYTTCFHGQVCGPPLTEEWLWFDVRPASVSSPQAGMLDCTRGKLQICQHATIRSPPVVHA